MSDTYTREKVSKRRKDTFVKKQKDKEEAKYSFFVKYNHIPCQYKYKEVTIPERKAKKQIFKYDFWGNLKDEYEEYTVPEHTILCKTVDKELTDHAFVKRVDISNRRKFAKKTTNRRLRREKPTYEINGWETYIEIVDNKPVIRYRYTDADWDYKYDCKGAGYQKAFDYAWEIW